MSETHLHALPAGTLLEEYEIVRVLGAGGFGITYLAFDHTLDGPVALKEYFPAGLAARADGRKVAPASTQSREGFTWGLDRFIDEARAIHRFRHPNVVRVHRYVEAHGTAYIVMEYVEGESLAAILESRGRLPSDTWRRWLHRLLDGLTHIHRHGYLHRDIKPSNIIVRAADGEPVLIDFGAARAAARERTHTRVLTPEYAPIEQHSSQAAQGPPTDIYALAAVSCLALTGAPPPSAPDRMLDDQHDPLAGRVAGADTAWLAALDQGLALLPQHRPQTVEAWRAVLRGGSDPPEPGHSAPKTARSEAPVNNDTTAPVRRKRMSGRLFVAAAGLTVLALYSLSILISEADRAQLINLQLTRIASGGRYGCLEATTRTTLDPTIMSLRAAAGAGDTQALARLQQMADEGLASAQFCLAELFNLGEGVLRDDAQAVAWFRKAAVQGMGVAQSVLGSRYGLGEGVPRDWVLANMWFNIASANGDSAGRSARRMIEAELTQAQIADSTRRARLCMQSNYRDCN